MKTYYYDTLYYCPICFNKTLIEILVIKMYNVDIKSRKNNVLLIIARENKLDSSFGTTDTTTPWKQIVIIYSMFQNTTSYYQTNVINNSVFNIVNTVSTTETR